MNNKSLINKRSKKEKLTLQKRLLNQKMIVVRTWTVNYINFVTGLTTDEILNVLDIFSLGVGVEVIVMEYAKPQSRDLLLTNSIMPVVVKAKNCKMDVFNIIKAINKRTKAICLIGAPFHTNMLVQSFSSLRLAVPSNVLIVVDMTTIQYILDGNYSFPSPVLMGNVLVIKSLTQFGGLPAFIINHKHTNLASILAPRNNVNFFNTKNHFTTMLYNRTHNCSLCASRNLFWTTKLVVEAKANKLIVLNVYDKHIIIKLVKRMPVDVIYKTLYCNGSNISKTANNMIFNSICFNLGTTKTNIQLCKTLPTIKTINAIVETRMKRLSNHSPIIWQQTSKVGPHSALSMSISHMQRVNLKANCSSTKFNHHLNY